MGAWVRGRFLGRGTTASVHLAASTSGEQECLFAVKAAELSRSAALQREQRILSSLCSPHVVSCLGADVTKEADGRVLYNLFMEYVPGGCLAEVVKVQGGFDESVTRLYTRGILQGLAYLHSRGVVHCDVKGQNVLVGEEGMVVKLADLGCARWVNRENDGVGAISGTPLYMAPEVARGEEQRPAADIWALGCTVIEMATGGPAWRDIVDPVAAIHRIAFSDDVPELPCNVSDEARDFLSRCLDRDPRKRWSAEELLKHPFVGCADVCVSTPKRNSPKSILDQDMWDSWPEEEQDEDDKENKPQSTPWPQTYNQPLLDSAWARLRRLAGGRVPPPPLACDERCWITVRDEVSASSSSGSCWVSPGPSAGQRLHAQIPAGDDKPSTSPMVSDKSSGYCESTAVTAEGCAVADPCPPFFIVPCNAVAFVKEGDDTLCVHNGNSPFPTIPII